MSHALLSLLAIVILLVLFVAIRKAYELDRTGQQLSPRDTVEAQKSRLNELWRALMNIVLGDDSRARDLVEYERRLAPSLGEEELIERAIEHFRIGLIAADLAFDDRPRRPRRNVRPKHLRPLSDGRPFTAWPTCLIKRRFMRLVPGCAFGGRQRPLSIIKSTRAGGIFEVRSACGAVVGRPTREAE